MYYRYKLNITRHQPYSSNMNKLFKRKFMIIYLFWMSEFWHKSQVIIKWHFFREAGNLTIYESNEQPIHATSSEIYSQDLQTWNTTFVCAVLEWSSSECSSYKLYEKLVVTVHLMRPHWQIIKKVLKKV